MTMDEILQEMRKRLGEQSIKQTVKYDCGDEGVIFVEGSRIDTTDRAADCTLKISRENVAKLLNGDLQPITAMMTGKLKISGSKAAAMKLGAIMEG
ncbi:MAG: SCP2 sterol-binding domain-containing protein [Pseudomonadota bacterium]